MNDTARAKVFRDPNPTGTNLKEAINAVRDDLHATNINRLNQPGKWAVRYPNGDRPANEADTLFMAKARSICLTLIEQNEAQAKELGELKQANASLSQSLADLSEGFDKEIERMAAEVTALGTLASNQDAEIKALRAQSDTMLAMASAVVDKVQPETPAMTDFLEKSDMPQEPAPADMGDMETEAEVGTVTNPVATEASKEAPATRKRTSRVKKPATA